MGDAVQSCFCAFDIVYYNGSVLTNKPLKDRLKILEEVFQPLEGVIVHTPRFTVNKKLVHILSEIFYIVDIQQQNNRFLTNVHRL